MEYSFKILSVIALLFVLVFPVLYSFYTLLAKFRVGVADKGTKVVIGIGQAMHIVL